MRRTCRAIVAFILSAAWLPIVANPSYTVEVPQTLHVRSSVRVEKDIPSTKELPFAATHIGVDWQGSEQGPEIRMSSDGVQWRRWQTVEASEDLSDHERGIFFSSLIGASEARFIQIRNSPAHALSAARITGINVRDGPKRKLAAQRSASAAAPAPNIVSRAAWGADERLRSGTPDFAPVNRLFVHHTVTANNDPDPAGTVRAIYAYHTRSRGWNDIGYNFLIDSAGVVYEGRFARAYDSGEIPNGEDRNGMGVIGAHVAGHNTGSVGVALLGDFTSVGPTTGARSALVNFLAWKADRHGIDPFHNIAGHRDAGSTACPGNQLYGQLPSIRQDTENRIQATTGLTAPAMPSGTQMIPSGKSRDLTPNATGAVSRSVAQVHVTFHGRNPATTRTLVLPASQGRYTLNDSDYSGIPLIEDVYTVRAVAYDLQGRASHAAEVANGYVVSTAFDPGYWLGAADGGVFGFGEALYFGGMAGRPLAQPIVGLVGSATGNGYWLVAADGGVFGFGDSSYFGGMAGRPLAKPIVGMARSASGNGYWLVAADGGVFSFGDAAFFGSTGGMALNKPIVGMARSASGNGYWLVAADGGVFSFGDAAFFGSTGAMRLNQPVVGMEASKSGGGYWLVAADGGIFSFGDAAFFGSTGAMRLNQPVVGMEASKSGGGYWLVAADGGVFSFGDAMFHGSTGGMRLSKPVVGMERVQK